MLEAEAGIADIIVTEIEVSRECSGLEWFPLHIALKLPAMQTLKISVGLIADIIPSIDPPPDAVVKVFVGRCQLQREPLAYIRIDQVYGLLSAAA